MLEVSDNRVTLPIVIRRVERRESESKSKRKWHTPFNMVGIIFKRIWTWITTYLTYQQELEPSGPAKILDQYYFDIKTGQFVRTDDRLIGATRIIDLEFSEAETTIEMPVSGAKA